jgi:hypothetical protein
MFPQPVNTASLPAQVRVMQIIVGALLMGVLLFAGIATFVTFFSPVVGPNNEAVPVVVPGPPMIAYFAAAMAVISILARLVVPGIIVRGSVKTLLNSKPIEAVTKLDFVPIYQNSLIVASALIEGAVLINCVAVIADHQPWSLGIAALLIVIMGAGLPTVDRVDNWVGDQLRDSQLGGIN